MKAPQLLILLSLVISLCAPGPSLANHSIASTLPSASFVGEPRTYEMWSCDIGSNATELLLVQGGRRAILVAVLEEPGREWRILGINVSNGSVVAEARVLGVVRALATVGPFLAVATNESLLIFNASLGLSHEHAWRPDELVFFQALSDEELVFIHGKSASCFSTEEMGVKWSFSFEGADDIRACVLPEEGIAILRLENSAWIGCVLWPNGTRSPDLDITWLGWARGLELSSFNSTHFLLSAWNETYRSLLLVRSNDFSPRWVVELGPNGREGPFVLPDLNGDGVPEVLTWCSGRYRVLSGEEGSELYQLLGLNDVKAVAWVGKRLLAIQDGKAVRLVEFERSPGEIRWLWEEEASLVCELPDLDGDGLKELALSTGPSISCFWGSYDDGLPIISELWPEDGLSTSFTNVALAAKVSDEQSGLRRVIFKVDGEPVPAVFDEERGLYVADVRLGEGVHVWCVEAEDKVGYVAVSEARRLAINLSFFGDPGWLDDMAFFSSWAIALFIGGAVLLRAVRRREGLPQPSSRAT